MKQKEKSTLKSKTKSCQPTRKSSVVERTFQESEIADKLTKKIITCQLDIKLGEFTEKELVAVLKKIKSRKAADVAEIPPDVWKKKNLMTYFFNYATLCMNIIEEWTKGCIFLRKVTLGTIEA